VLACGSPIHEGMCVPGSVRMAALGARLCCCVCRKPRFANIGDGDHQERAVM
jgi:hypothetical protein